MFDWDCDGTSFKCKCSSKNCVGEIKGFKYLPKDIQKEKLPFVDDNVLKSYLDFYSENKVKKLGKILYDEYEIRKNSFGYGIYSKRNYKIGDLCYIGTFEILEDNGFHYIYETDNQLIVEEDPLINYVLLNGKRYRYSDCFINHSCDPNIYCGIQTKNNDELNKGEYNMIVRKEIKIGDELTCDYEMFDWDCNGHSFKCNCGSDNCRGYIKGFKYLNKELQEKYLQYADISIKELFYQTLNNDDKLI